MKAMEIVKNLLTILVATCLIANANAQTSVYIPDTNFRNFLQTTYPTYMNGDSLLTDSAALNVGILNCGSQNIVDLTGVEYFINIQNLWCPSNKLTGLPDLSNLTELIDLECFFNPDLGSLPDLSNNIKLEKIYCDFNGLTSIPDLTNNVNLKELICSANQITSLPDLSNNTALTDLMCQSNRLTELPDLNNHTLLTRFWCSNNNLDFSDARELRIGDTLSLNTDYVYSPQNPFGKKDTVNSIVGANVQLTIINQDSATSYQWYKDTTVISGATDTMLTLTNVQFSDSGVYTCKSFGTALTSLGFTEFVSEPITVILLPDTVKVWPGDADNSGSTNIFDIFPLGIAYNNIGSARDSIDITWEGKDAQSWSNSFANGINHKYADCNGDGTVNILDLDAIVQNYGLSHAKSGSQPYNAVDPSLQLLFAKDSVNAGDTISVPIMLGEATNQVTELYGLAFSILYSNAIIDTSSISMMMDNSILGSELDTSVLKIVIRPINQNRIEVGFCRTTKTNISGYGEVGALNFVIIDNVSGKRVLSEQLDFTVEGIMGITYNEDSVPLNGTTSSLVVNEKVTAIHSLSLNNSIQLFPIPAENVLYINIEGYNGAKQISMLNILGVEVKRIENLNSNQMKIDLQDLKNGIYFVNFETEFEQVTKRITISK